MAPMASNAPSWVTSLSRVSSLLLYPRQRQTPWGAFSSTSEICSQVSYRYQIVLLVGPICQRVLVRKKIASHVNSQAQLIKLPSSYVLYILQYIFEFRAEDSKRSCNIGHKKIQLATTTQACLQKCLSDLFPIRLYTQYVLHSNGYGTVLLDKSQPRGSHSRGVSMSGTKFFPPKSYFGQ